MASPPRLRIFAGPNGSGKSIMKKQVEGTVVRGRPLDLGVYINADEIARILREDDRIDLSRFGIKADRPTLRKFAVGSGLFKGPFRMDLWQQDHMLDSGSYVLRYAGRVEHHAQLLAAFLCHALMAAGKSF